MRIVAVLLSLVALSDSAKASVIAGHPVYCYDARGYPVSLIPDPFLADVGMARILPNGVPAIILNPRILNALPPAIQLFWYAHECGHHVLGHVSRPLRLENEMDADCWAIRTGRDQGWFTFHDLQNMHHYFINNPGSPWGHLPGPQRLALFEHCFHS